MFERYHFSENARIITSMVPGPKSKDLLKKQGELEGNNISYPRGIPIAFDKAKGAVVTDVDGNTYIDFFSSCGVMNLGHNNTDILDEMKNYPDIIVQAVDFPTKARIDFSEKLLKSLPKEMLGQYKLNFGGPTGSDAVEAAIKLARINTKRHGMIAFQGGYHGMTLGALSVTSKLSHREDVSPLVPGIHFFPYCSSYRCPFGRNKIGGCNFECVDFFRDALENPHSGIDKPAAIIIEPIQGEGGTYIPKEGWLEQIVDIARKNGVLVIFDEIQTGFYRTGKLFSFEHTKAVPDIITMSKGIGGIGLPLSLILYKKGLDTWKSGTHIGTFRGSQLSMIAGLAAMNLVEKLGIESHVSHIGSLMRERLIDMQERFSFIGEVRSSGLMFGIEYVKNRLTKEPDMELAKKVRKFSYENGLLVEIGGYFDNVVRFLPPLVITETLAHNGLDIFEKANAACQKSTK
ncbi:MAG: aspartate aminotransferase family protein [bacterium]|nr:aspartate aminotransferase family protein [bacterium]